MLTAMLLRPVDPVRTTRLLLRPLTADDAADMAAYRSIPDVCRYIPDEPLDLAEVERRLAGRWSTPAPDAPVSGLMFGVVLEGGTLIGDVCLFTGPPEHRGGEVGWVLSPAYGGHGYATEAAHALLHLAFDTFGLHRVAARVDTRNDASLRVVDRLGMRREAHLRENEWFKGAWSDEIDSAILDREWTAGHEGGRPPGCSR